MNILKRILKMKPHRIGLALSGGALHGAAHIGVLRVLESAGIFPTMIAGTSAGAIIGSVYAAGTPVEKISTLWHQANWPSLIKVAWKNSLGLFDTQPLEKLITTEIGDITFEQLPKRFSCVACDLMQGEAVIFDHGPVAPAVRASAAFPGLFQPISSDGKLLLDGGIIDNLPVEQTKAMGAEYIIAVDLSVGKKLKDPPSNLFELLYQVTRLMQTRSALPDPKTVDCYIHPQVGDFSQWSFGNAADLERRGEEAATAALGQLLRELRIKH